VLVLGQPLRRDLDPHLVQRSFALLADLVALLGHDRNLAHLRQEQPRELVDLGRGRPSPSEDAEVDTDLHPRRLDLAHAEGDLRLDPHLQGVLTDSSRT